MYICRIFFHEFCKQRQNAINKIKDDKRGNVVSRITGKLWRWGRSRWANAAAEEEDEGLNNKTSLVENIKRFGLITLSGLNPPKFNSSSSARSGCTPVWFSYCTGSPGPVYCGPASYVCGRVGLSPHPERVEAGGSAGSLVQAERGPALPRLCWEGLETCRSLCLWRCLWVCWGTGWRESCAWGWVCRWLGLVSGSWGSGLSWVCRGTCWVCGHTTPKPGT